LEIAAAIRVFLVSLLLLSGNHMKEAPSLGEANGHRVIATFIQGQDGWNQTSAFITAAK
jgi:hypothetical protein